MRIVTSEFGHNYATYSFGYTVHALIDPSDQLRDVYAHGFLPYSAHPRAENIFYLARSLRLHVPSFTPSSENRRIFQKYDSEFTSRTLSIREACDDTPFIEQFLAYFKDRHGEDVMSRERLMGMLERDLPLRVIEYRAGDTPAAYVLEVATPDFLHYWFSSYDLSYAGAGLGMWLMQDAVRRAEAEGVPLVYLGTGYGEKAKYKTNIPDLEFWNGSAWVRDQKLLRTLLVGDVERSTNIPGGLPEAIS